MKVFTIGFTQKPAEVFFGRLTKAGVRRVVDVRLNNVSQLAGFAKRDDLRYFRRAIGGIDYVHAPELAPTQEIMDAFKKKKGGWSAYEKAFQALLEERRPEDIFPKDLFDNACLLCSEDKPEHCHRRLVAEHMAKQWGGVEILHL